MKIRESGMPDESLWSTFFNVEKILDQMEVLNKLESVVEIGCGYGTFTIPVANRIIGRLFTFDIDSKMIKITKSKSKKLTNIEYYNRDVLKRGTGLENNSVDYFMLFNILHNKKPIQLLNEAKRVLKKGGKVGIVHWKSDIDTPRGPSFDIRPKPEDCISWIKESGLKVNSKILDLKPYHYGIIALKPK